MGHVGVQDSVAAFGIGFGAPPGTAPVTALAIGALSEIHGVPELGRDKFRRVVIDADHAATAGSKFGGRAVEPPVAVLHGCSAVKRRPHGEPAHVVNVKQATVPERLIVEPYLRAFIQVDRNAHLTQGGIGLGSPGASRLAVATGAHSEDALYIQRSRALAPLELGHALDISEIPEINRRGGWDAMEIGVIADVVQGEGPHHVPTPALLEYAGFFADDLESSANAESRQIARQMQGGVIGSGFHVILGVEPENDVDGPGGTQNIHRQKYQEQSHASFHIDLSPATRAPGSTDAARDALSNRNALLDQGSYPTSSFARRSNARMYAIQYAVPARRMPESPASLGTWSGSTAPLKRAWRRVFITWYISK